MNSKVNSRSKSNSQLKSQTETKSNTKSNHKRSQTSRHFVTNSLYANLRWGNCFRQCEHFPPFPCLPVLSFNPKSQFKSQTKTESNTKSNHTRSHTSRHFVTNYLHTHLPRGNGFRAMRTLSSLLFLSTSHTLRSSPLQTKSYMNSKAKSK